jgi:BirA family biotin operon repressor/biotin-[acetyl-CoA-carboxylase] ligase
MDVAHEIAATGDESGVLIVAESQSVGRGREGRKWHADTGGVWLTWLSRNRNLDAAQVLSIRVGLELRAALEDYARSRLTLKWPNDIFDSEGKVAGVLTETRWREGVPDWTAIGVGVNLLLPPQEQVVGASSLRAGASRAAVLCTVATFLKNAAEAEGPLTRDEVQQYMQYDMLRGRKVSSPLRGVIVGISEDGELVVSCEDGIQTVRSGTVQLEQEQ